MRPLAQLLSARRGDDHQRMRRIRDQVSRLCRGWPAERVGKIVTRHLDELILPSGYAEARALPARHRDAGQDVIIVSTSGQEIVRPIGTVLGATCVVATRMEIANGHYTGSGGVLRLRRTKAMRMRELDAGARLRHADCYAYRDCASDLPMLELVGHPHAVNPDRALRKSAHQRGRPVLAFAAPLPRAQGM